MQHPFAALQAEYEDDLSRVKIIREAEVDEIAAKLLRHVDEGRYDPGCMATAVPVAVAAASFEREAGSNFRLSPAQGDPWDEVSRDVPRGLGPYASWTAAQVAAYRIDSLDKVGAGNWTWARFCYEEELFNGFGPRAHGRRTGYLWSGTNLYDGGKYVADNEWNPKAEDEQLGVVPIVIRLVQMRAALRLADSIPALVLVDPPLAGSTPSAPLPVPPGHHDAEDLQKALNEFGADPQLQVDGSYGRHTRRAVEAFQRLHGLAVDGIAGDQTWAAVDAALRTG